MNHRIGFFGLSFGLLITAVFITNVVEVTAAEIKCVTEYRYPTSFQVTPILAVGPNGASRVVGGLVEPGDFETREVGVHMAVEAFTYNPAGGLIEVASFDSKRQSDTTDLMLAATAGDDKTVKRLLAAGAPVNARNREGSTAMMGAAAGGFETVVNLLLKHQAQVNIKSKDGSTPLIFAARNGHTAVVKTLLMHGADVQAADVRGMTSMQFAAKGGYDDVVKLLAAKGISTDDVDGKERTDLILASAARKDGKTSSAIVQVGAEK